ncbi:MAG: nitroreductase/quinone reductase family protein [Microthrixaceae bacterium]
MNLRDQPRVQAMRRGADLAMDAEILTGDERVSLWNRVTSLEPRYARYQSSSRTEREIPLIVLRPAAS